MAKTQFLFKKLSFFSLLKNIISISNFFLIYLQLGCIILGMDYIFFSVNFLSDCCIFSNGWEKLLVKSCNWFNQLVLGDLVIFFLYANNIGSHKQQNNKVSWKRKKEHSFTLYSFYQLFLFFC